MSNNSNLKIDPADFSIHAWIRKHGIKNEKGEPIEFKDHLFLYDIYADPSDQIVCIKAAQIGFSTLAILKNIYDAWSKKMEIIHTLPTDHDVGAFVSGKVDRIIANNPVLSSYTENKDSVEQKQVGESMIYYRGTWTKKAAIMITADRLVHDEKDSSKLDIVADYQARLQHSKFKQTHAFSHPSLPETGIHSDWLISDQKYWMITCSYCKHEQYLSWNTEDIHEMSIDIERKEFVCKKCYGVIDRKTRSVGKWIAKYPERKISGYWIPLLIAPWISAADIIAKFQDPQTSQEFFYTKILGLPYADGTAKLIRGDFLQNLTNKAYAATQEERVIIGIDTGLKLDYVIGNAKGLFYHGQADDYDKIDEYMKRWPKAIAVVDNGGDLIGSRKFYEKWRGRVFLCGLTQDHVSKELMRWGNGDEHGFVAVDRNRMIQLVIGEFRDKRIPVHGTENDWYEYWLDWNNLSKIKVIDPDTNQVTGYKWVRRGRDHKAMATVFWRVGMDRFGQTGGIFMPKPESERTASPSYMIDPDRMARFNPEELFKMNPFWWAEDSEENDWRDD